MKVVVCLDERDGMLFLNRRQSQDRMLRRQVLEMSADSVLWMNGYSARQFTEEAPQLRVDETFLEKAGAGEFCFVENADVLPWRKRIEQLVIYRWNRHYPSDVKFPMDAFRGEMKLECSREFPGSSHECITEEVYSL